MVDVQDIINDSDPIESTFAHDDSDVENDKEKHYEEHFWPNSEAPNGYSFKSKKQAFRKSIDSLKISFKKGAHKKINDLEVTVQWSAIS